VPPSRSLEGAADAGARTELLDLRELDLPMYDPDNDEPGVALWLRADDPSCLHDKLAEAGVAIVTPPFEGRFGLTFEDPDGYIITIHG
jgi:hypothetical protein